MVQILALIVEWRNIITGEKTQLVIGGTWTQVLTDSMAIVASALYHRATFDIWVNFDKSKLGCFVFSEKNIAPLWFKFDEINKKKTVKNVLFGAPAANT